MQSRDRYQDSGEKAYLQDDILEIIDFSCKMDDAYHAGIKGKYKENKLLPLKRQKEYSESLLKKSKTLAVSYEEWEPFSRALLSLEFLNESEELCENDLKERRDIALRISTPEGLTEIINELEGKLSLYEDIPNDPEFENLSIEEKIEKLFQDYLVNK